MRQKITITKYHAIPLEPGHDLNRQGRCVPFSQKEEARLDRTFSPVEVEHFFLSTKDIKPNELVAIMLKLMAVSLFSTEDSYFTCKIWVKRAEVNIKTYGNWKSFVR